MSMQTLDLPPIVLSSFLTQQSQPEQPVERLQGVHADPRRSPASINQSARSHGARARERAARARLEAEKAEARALGVQVIDKRLISDQRWTDAEDQVIREMGSAKAIEIQLKLPHRSPRAIEKRRHDLNLGKKVAYWSNHEVELLMKNAPKMSIEDLLKIFPNRNAEQIYGKCARMGIRRGSLPLRLTGDWLCDAIRDRCRVLNYSSVELDAMAGTGTYFSMRTWKQRAGHFWHPMVKAAKMLGGELRVEWPD